MDGTENDLQKATKLSDGYIGHYKPKGMGVAAKRILSKNSINHIIKEPFGSDMLLILSYIILFL